MCICEHCDNGAGSAPYACKVLSEAAQEANKNSGNCPVAIYFGENGRVVGGQFRPDATTDYYNE